MQVTRSTDVSSRGTITVCTLSPTRIQDTRTIYGSLAAHLNSANEQTSPEPSHTSILQLPRLLQGHRLRRYGASIVFANSGNIDFCDTSVKSCKNDGNEYTKAGKVQDPSTKPTRRQYANSIIEEGGSYLLKSGQIVVSAQPLNSGDRAVRVKRINETLFAEYNDLHVPDPEQGLDQYDYMMHNLYLEEDIVVGSV